ncbi:methyl-accepting chemotaxis protein [Idiomarina xiamenensis]|uniref:Methyl-accepting chemotaxis protein n=1 Tax=Idiomarina xiamenensis 10-D-4 TaxID=740709 RepID=K2KLK8_9GAMM|nr:methyl-accepting chemotaxis protein [Idiomarina xiamenensis]EKE87472.1 methyl-accepting chemotaxis protein [Idiomarina xiamenensis 10-D-4]
MKITVAMRVIGGFAIITLLLLVISLSSLFSINGIGDSSDRVNTMAVPALNAVANVKTDVLELSNIELATYHDTTMAEVDAHYAKFEESHGTMMSSLNELKGLLAGQGQSSLLNQADAEIESYVGLLSTMFEQQRRYLQLGQQTKSQLDDIAFTLDDASIALLDAMDAANSETVKKAASNLENAIASLVTLLYDLQNADSLDGANVIASEINIALEGIDTRIQELQSAASASNDMVGSAISTIGDAKASLQTSDSYPNNVIKRMETRQQARDTLSKSEEQLASVMAITNKTQDSVQAISGEASADVRSAISTSSWTNSILTIVSIALAVLISYITVRSISRPLSRVNHMLNVMAEGKLTERVDYQSEDEFGELARNTNKLTENLAQLVRGIASRATQLATAAEESSTVSVQTTKAIEDQRGQIEQVATATQEMNSTSSEMANGAEEALREIQHSDEEATRVRTISHKNKETIEVLAQEIQGASEVINKLYENSTNIGGILDVIRGIADQTNLLALNAAIEAARAGEQGRGFAVVADEVRTLASRTQESTEEIHQMIESLQSDAQRAVTVMNKGREQAEISVGQTEEAAQALQAITDSVHQAADSSNHIASGALEQSRTAQDISERLEAIVAIAEQTASGSKQTAAASNEVAKLADELQDSIRSFSV